MRFLSTTVILLGVLASVPSVLRAGAGDERDVSQTLQTYCAGCHNGTMRSPSGAVLDRLDIATIADNPDLWSRAYRQLNAGTMPPFGAARPDRTTYRQLLSSIETGLGATTPPSADNTSQQIAERLSALLWNSAPDAELLGEVRRNRLTQPAALEKQVQRMLADDRADAFVSRFFFPWLGLDRLSKAEPNPQYFPGYTAALRDAMTTETDLFIRSQLRDNHDPVALWDADYTFLNEALARHYGISGITGAEFRRVSLSTPERNGLLGQGSVLMATSRHEAGKGSAYTSPAARAIWVRTHFLGAPPPLPFPNARPVKPELPITPQTRTLPAEPCVNCHRNFFPLGYALEHFDPIGGWRTSDQAGPVDASGTLVDGTPFDGTIDLRKDLLQYSEAFRTTITEKLLMYAAGKAVNGSQTTPETLVRARQVLHAIPSPRWSSLIASIVRMKPLSDS
jgi:hypothetical protein